MKFDMVPYVNIYELNNALCEANLYDEDRDGSLRNFLFGDCYYNDSAMRLSFEGDSLYDETDEELQEWYTLEEIKEMNEKIVRTNIILGYLKTMFPRNCEYILVDVSW